MPDDGLTEDPRATLFARLAALGIETATVPYPAHRTVEEGKALRGAMAGQFTKNLLLKDKKGALFMVVADEDRPIDLRRLHVYIGAQGRLGFAAAELMREILHVEPGALTPLSLLHDKALRVKPVIDAKLMTADQLNFHPLVNTESTGIAPQALLTFIKSCGHVPLIVDFDAMASADAGAGTAAQ
jgi:Ala-tRNA(Pro) deacylase